MPEGDGGKRDRQACLMGVGKVTDGQTRGKTGGQAGNGQTDEKRAEEEGQR